MPGAARVGDPTVHGGVVVGPGVATVMIAGMPAAVLGDLHACPVTAPSHLPSSPFVAGSGTVTIGGRPALRAGDTCACGASVPVGAPTVVIA
jgi:uncharacterized Zn-binding protein involved in type VI secretion